MTNSMIYGGFDLSFIDVNVKPMNESNEFIMDLPQPGTHHTNTEVNLIPGGNGFNLCRTLSTLGRKVTYVGASSKLFEELIHKNEINLELHPIQNAEVNYTIILNLKDGEVQFNSTKHNLSPAHLDDEICSFFSISKLKPISNVALNSESIELVSSLLLYLYEPDNNYIYDPTIPFKSKLNLIKDFEFDGILFIDPSDISHYDRVLDFIEILKSTRKFYGEKYLSVNEFELRTLQDITGKSPKEIADFFELPLIYHTADFVNFYGSELLELRTKEIQDKKYFVGAGDCFNGSFLHKIFDSNSIYDSLIYAIENASYLIEKGKYPSNH